MNKPFIIEGFVYKDHRGEVTYNNAFNLADIQRVYTIQNLNSKSHRGWKGHIIENRWFFCSQESTEIRVRKIDEKSNTLEDIEESFILNSSTLDVLFVPKGYATMIIQQSFEAKVVVFSDYSFETKEKDYRW